MIYRYKIQKGEVFFGGESSNSKHDYYDRNTNAQLDFNIHCSNQTMPLFVSTKGRYIWSDNPFKTTIKNGYITIHGKNVKMYNAGSTLKEAYLAAMNAHFPSDKRELPEIFFRTAQYNTWMEYTYDPTQEGVLKYAHAIVDNGFEPGVLMIDEGWHGRYGTWEFDFHKFPEPKKMIDELHALGFKVMLWVVPLVCPDGREFVLNTATYIQGAYKDADKKFVRTKDGEVALFKWWNGVSALLDLRKEWDIEFLDSQLKYLMDKYGVDGFKFDGGNVSMYAPENIVNGKPAKDYDAHELNIAWNEFGRRYEFHEYKDTYLGGGKNCIQRLRDRHHNWDNGGINTLIPSSIIQGLIGHPFICPDMIGGGEWTYSILPGFNVDEELFVRMAQVSALCPMMQFSWAPWRALSEKNLNIVRDCMNLHKQFADKIVALVKESEASGEPILRSLEYNDPGKGYEYIMDQFMLGTDILAAPVVTPNTYKRDVVFPAGEWVDADGNVYEGNKTYNLDAPIEKLLWFERKQ